MGKVIARWMALGEAPFHRVETVSDGRSTSGMAGMPKAPALRSFIGGLGGKDISHAEFDHLLERFSY